MENTIQTVLYDHVKCEREKKVEDLYKFFCNNVFLGQWELAKTAIPTLIKELGKSDNSVDFVQVLINIADYPFSQSLGSTAVPSPHHLSWLCLQELKQLFPQPDTDKKALIYKLTTDVDFRLTLAQLNSEDDVHIKELYTYFKNHVLNLKTPVYEDDPERGQFLSKATLSFLKKTMMSTPSLCDNIIRALMTEENSAENRSNELLQAIYLDCVNRWVDRLEDGINMNLSTEDLVKCVNGGLYILAFYNPVPYWNYLQLRQLFTRMITLAIGGNIPSLSPERIVSYICGRQTPYLLDEFSKIYQEVSQLTIAKSVEDRSEYLSENHRHCLHMMKQLDRNVSWRDFFIACHKKGTHFLAEILELSLALVKSGEFIQLQDLLSYLELQPLKSAVLLMGWSHCVTSAHARTLLDTLWNDPAECCNPRLATGCRKLAYHLDLMQWCMDRAKPILRSSESSPSHQATELLQGLETHSVLYMLHQSTSLASLDHAEVLQLLTNVSADKKKEIRKKTVTFQDESKPSESSPEPVNIEQQKDLSIYRGYCALKNVMDAVMFCVDNFEHDLMNPVQVKKVLRTRKLHRSFTTDQSVSSSEGEDSSSGDMYPSEADKARQKENSQIFRQSYNQMVTVKLKESREHLSNLQPLTFRLEVLENIFSLLFLTHEDLHELNGATDPETDDDNDGNKNSSLDSIPQDNHAMSEEEYINDEHTFHKSKVETKISRKSPSSMGANASSVPQDGCLDYDVPFDDPYQRPTDPQVVPGSVQSSYFTPDPEHVKHVLETSKQNQQEKLQASRKVRKKRRRLNSEPSPNTIVGFLCNEYLVRDILYLLKDSITDLNMARLYITSKTLDSSKQDISRTSKPMKSDIQTVNPNLEAVLQANIPTSIQQDTFSKRLAKLSQTIHEAWWRFQLVAHEAFPRQPSVVLSEKIYITDSDINFLPVSDGMPFTPETEGDFYISSASRRMSGSHMLPLESGIMSKMMSSPETLLINSLERHNPSQAAEVMKLFKLREKTAETCEVNFAEVYQASCRKIWELEPEYRESAAQTQTQIGKRSIKALSKAAAVGVATAVLSSIVEDLLANSCVPPVPKPKQPSTRENFSFLFNLDPSSALLLDLLCTCCRTWDTCSNMLDIIKTKTKLLKHDPRHLDALNVSSSGFTDSSLSEEMDQSQSYDSSGTSPSATSVGKPKILRSASLHGITGCTDLLWSLYDLIHVRDGGPSATVAANIRHHVPVTAAAAAKFGLQHHFQSAYSSLHADKLRSMEMATAELRRAVDYVLQALEGFTQEHHMDIVIDEPGSSQSPSPQGSITSSLSGSASGSMTSGGTSSAARGHAKQPVEQNPLHVTIKHLMHVMEKYVPGEGLAHILLGTSSRVSGPPGKNYLLSLYEHVKEMSYLVAECEGGKNAEVSSNYFKVLKDGPVNILGRLMFVKMMPPARLEAVAEKLSLNLTHTIVRSCCPKIPSKHPPSVPECGADISVRTHSTRVYNIQQPFDDNKVETSEEGQDKSQQKIPQSPEELVRSILSNLIKLMEGVSSKQNAKGIFDLTCAEKLVQMPEYNQAIVHVNKLKDIDLNKLASKEERLCFFVNLANMMVLHCHLSHIYTRWQINSKRDTNKDTDDIQDIELCPLGAADYMAYFSSFSYEIGQLGLVSAYDLLTTICCDELKPSSQWKHILKSRKLRLSPDDTWKVFSPLKQPNLLFVLNMGCLSSPPLQVMHPDRVMSQMEKAMKDYLCHSVIISVEQDRVVVPQLLIWHGANFVEWADSSSQDTRHVALIRWLAQYLSAEKQRQLQQIFGLDSAHDFSVKSDTVRQNEQSFSVDTDLFDNGFCVTFDISHVKVGHISSPKPATNIPKSRPQAFRLLSSIDRSGHGWSLELPSYNLTPVTLEYVKQDSLLVATMVSLVCSDNLDNIEQHFTDDHFTMSESTPVVGSLGRLYSGSRLRTQHSDISLVDIRSYRYHRLTDDYPILQRHLLHYILPLAGADNPELLTSSEPILKFVTNDIDAQVKLCMFSLPNSDQFQCVIQDMANRLMEEHKWTETLSIIRSLPESVVTERLYLQALHDYSLSSWAISQVGKPGFGPKVGDGLRKFYSCELLARTVLTICHALPLDLCIDLLNLCMTQLTKGSGLWKTVNARYQETSVFNKIMDCVKALRIKLSMKDVAILSMNAEDQHLHRILEELADRSVIPRASQERPKDVLLVLEKAGDFTTARSWATVHKLPQGVIQDIEERHLFYQLAQDPSDTVSAFQLLDSLRVLSETQCLSVCQSVADRLTRPRDIKFVVGFLLQFLSHHLSPDDVENLRLKRIGAKALMCIPQNLQGEYSHLMSCPHLILEQLLMNMKAELAGQIFEQIKQDFIEIKERKLRVLQDQFNSLLASYANKAIEVDVVQVEDKSQSENLSTNNQGNTEDSDQTASPSKTDRRKNDATSSPSHSLSSRQEAASRLSVKLRRESNISKFVMPHQVPSQEQWVPDSATSVCMICGVERFSMFNRRHHCRRCGRVVCASCSSRQMLVLGVMSRACDECYEQAHSSGDHRAQEEHEIYSRRIKEQLSGTSSSPVHALNPSPSLTGNLAPNKLKRSMESAIHHVNHSWKLRPDVAYSDRVRAEFYYEQAPSVSLCISLLKQHSIRGEAGKLVLSMCDKLSTYLVPISPGVPNPEIDYSLIISVMKQLLFQAKLDFLHTGNTGMTELCEVYLGRVDLLNVMVKANYQELPTIKELTKQDTVRRLRDKLIADERLSLAMEVSTKCGIDPAGVWSAMGFACLHLGDFIGARDKFAHCLKVPSDKNQISGGQSRLLGEILEFLDTIPSSGFTEVQRLLSDPGSICDIKKLLVPSAGEENRVESVPYQECLYYLRSYGSFMDHISFLRQHSYWMKAVQFAVDHHCSADVFVNGLMVPAMNSGELGRLLEQMLMLDPTLEKWMGYLTAVCKHLLKQKYFNTLYQVQLFMKDYIRAAMTCISHFYQRGATSYLDLSGRLQFLYTAHQHLQAYLDPGQWGSVHHPLAPHSASPPTGKQTPTWDKQSPESAARMTLSPEEVKKHVRTIALQIEVTKFLEQCLTQSMGDAGATSAKFLPRPTSQICTLFGSLSARTELVSLIVLSGADLSSGFSLGIRIVRECRLNPTLIFTHCSRELAKQSRFSDISTLIQSLIREGLVDDDAIDEIVGASLLVIADSHSQAVDESDSLIQLLRNDSNKINAFILCGKLRSAYLLAVKRDRVDDVQRIAGAAQRLGQGAVKNICKKWLEQHQK